MEQDLPQFGTVAALNLVKCLNGPAAPAPQDPKNLKVGVLLMGVQNDPIAGNGGWRPPRRRSSTGAASKRVIWQGIGHGALDLPEGALAPLTPTSTPARRRRRLRTAPPEPCALVHGYGSGVTAVLRAFRPRSALMTTARCFARGAVPIAIMSIIHRSWVLTSNGYITDDWAPVYRAVRNFRAGVDIYNEHLDYVDPHYLYPPGGTLLMAPFGYINTIFASHNWFVAPNTVAIIAAACLLVRMFRVRADLQWPCPPCWRPCSSPNPSPTHWFSPTSTAASCSPRWCS